MKGVIVAPSAWDSPLASVVDWDTTVRRPEGTAYCSVRPRRRSNRHRTVLVELESWTGQCPSVTSLRLDVAPVGLSRPGTYVGVCVAGPRRRGGGVWTDDPITAKIQPLDLPTYRAEDNRVLPVMLTALCAGLRRVVLEYPDILPPDDIILRLVDRLTPNPEGPYLRKPDPWTA